MIVISELWWWREKVEKKREEPSCCTEEPQKTNSESWWVAWGLQAAHYIEYKRCWFQHLYFSVNLQVERLCAPCSHMMVIVGRHWKIHQMLIDAYDWCGFWHTDIFCNQVYECLEQENSLLRKEVQLLLEEQQRLKDALKAHEPLCPVLNCGMTSTSRSAGTMSPEFMSR